MSGPRRTLAALLASGAVVAALGAAPASAGRGDDPPERLLVTAREYRLTLSQTKLGAGDSIVQLYDYGEDPHDLALQREGGSRIFSVGVVQPGEVGELRLRLKRRSTYRLWCTLGDHAARGMAATLRTKRR